jgi:8-oxo-dGTP diphosphatase
MRQGAGALLVLPDGRIVLQRRTKDAPTGAGKLSFFGGAMDEGETPLMAVRRELGEETDLPIDSLEFVPAVSIVTSKDEGSDEKWRANIFRVEIETLDFKFFEGDGAEAYSVDEIMQRQDLTTVARDVFDKLFGGKHGT